MTLTEARLRELMREVADQAAPAVLLPRVAVPEPRPRWRQALPAAGLVAAVVAALVAAVLAGGVGDQQPARSLLGPVVHRGVTTSTSPGDVLMAVSVLVGGDQATAVHVVPADGGQEVEVPPADDMLLSGGHRLSRDGRYLVRLCTGLGCDAQVQVLDLRTGADRRFEAPLVQSAELSPDGEVLAWAATGSLHLLRTATGEQVERELSGGGPATAVGWSPDGRTVAVQTGLDVALFDRAGSETGRLNGLTMTNGGMSWSPDGLSLLGSGTTGGTSSHPVDGGEATAWAAPEGMVRSVGWAGGRVVWLVGKTGEQSLVLADPSGRDLETWVELDVGQRVESVVWSDALSRGR
jgi:hypothetical protein